LKQLIDNNNYVYNRGSEYGIYIIHGFTNSTYEIRDLTNYLAKKGYYTVANNLPGHGTSVNDCNRCTYIDWISFVEKDIAEMSNECENIYVIGISMGSVLALHLCSVFPIKAAVFAATVIEFKDFIGTNILTPLLHKLIPLHKKKYSYPQKIRQSLTYHGYDYWPMSAVNEMRKLTNKVKKELSLIKNPCLIIESKKDKLQLLSNVDLIYNSINSLEKEKFFVNDAGHNLFCLSSDQKIIFEKVASFIKQNKY